jgi:hypothetical protein
MATRRIKPTINNSYVQPLKLRTGRKVVLSPSSDYNSILFTKARKSPVKSDYTVNVAAKFDTQNFDGINLMAELERDNQALQIGYGTFEVYSVSLDGNWTETLLSTVSGSLIGTKLVASLNASSLPELDGEVTLAIKCTINRQIDAYTKKIYVNHLGTYDSIVRLRQDVEFLDITKVDE